jgi:DNA-3-methyladenine glycosylase II
MTALNPRLHALAVGELVRADPDLERVVARYGSPKFWSRPVGFSTLVYIVFEQQVSLASARATYDKVCALLPAFTPAAYLALSDSQLRGAGVSRQKARYTRLLARAIHDGSLPIAGLGRRPDARVRELLTQITGIGHWTADVYLMVALRRPDCWPTGDLALVKAVQVLKGLDERPDKSWLEELGERYRPYRSVATHIYWHYYLSS